MTRLDYFGAPSHLRQAHCDAIQAQFRREQAAPAGPASEPERRSIRREPPRPEPGSLPTDDPLRLRMAEELEYVRRVIEAMGDMLAGDPLLVTRHTVSLQSIDIVGQILGHVASVTRSSDPEAAVRRIGMTELKARLNRKAAL